MSGFPQNRYFFIKSRADDVVLDVYNGELEKDTNIIIYKKKTNNDIDNQLWYVEDGFVINKKSGLVLDIRGGELESNNYLVQNERQFGSQTQQFGYREGFIYLLADANLVVDIKGGRTREGTKMIIYEAKAEDNTNQLWTLEPIAGTVQSTQQGVFGEPSQTFDQNYMRYPQNDGIPTYDSSSSFTRESPIETTGDTTYDGERYNPSTTTAQYGSSPSFTSSTQYSNLPSTTASSQYEDSQGFTSSRYGDDPSHLDNSSSFHRQQQQFDTYPTRDRYGSDCQEETTDTNYSRSDRYGSDYQEESTDINYSSRSDRYGNNYQEETTDSNYSRY